MGRRLLILAVFLGAGAVVNVAVAWGCTVLSSVQGDLASYTPRKELRGFGLHIDLEQRGSDGLNHIINVALSAGWPLTALRFEESLLPPCDPDETDEEALFTRTTYVSTISVVASITPRRAFSIPRMPIWPGFAINTVFYATVLWLLIPGPFALRRSIRRRRGLCPKCAYPVGESSVCTECGRELAT